MKKFYKIGLAVLALWSIVVCNISAQSEKDFQVTLTEDGTGVVITGYTGKTDKIVIPSTIQGYPVKEIAISAFKVYITSIIIPNTVERLDGGVFREQKYLESVTLSNSLKYIGNSCFYGCTKLKGIVIPDSVQVIEEYAFFDTPNLTTLKLPNSDVKIKSGAFIRCGMKNLVITHKMIFDESSQSWFMGGCNNLETLIIEADVKSLPHNFLSSETLRTITFKSPNTEIFEDTFDALPNLDLASQAALKKLKHNIVLSTQNKENEEQQKIDERFETLKKKIEANGFTDVEKINLKLANGLPDANNKVYAEEYIIASVSKAKFMELAKVKKVNDRNLINFLSNPNNMSQPVYSINGIKFYMAFAEIGGRYNIGAILNHENGNSYELSRMPDYPLPFLKKKNSDCVFSIITKEPFATTTKTVSN